MRANWIRLGKEGFRMLLFMKSRQSRNGVSGAKYAQFHFLHLPYKKFRMLLFMMLDGHVG